MGNTISRDKLARLASVTPARISQWVKEGLLVTDKRGEYPARENLERLVRHFANRAGLEALKAEKLRRETELLDVQLAKAHGNALDAASVEKAWANIVTLARGRFLRIPNKLAPRLPFCKSEKEIEQALAAEVDEALGELSRAPDYG